MTTATTMAVKTERLTMVRVIAQAKPVVQAKVIGTGRAIMVKARAKIVQLRECSPNRNTCNNQSAAINRKDR